MKLLATIKPRDVDSSAPDFDFDSFKTRDAVRGVVVGEQSRIALIHVTKHDYYMLPGGGVDGGGIEEELLRELQEELGVKTQIISEVGRTQIYIDRWQKVQTDYCYILKVLGGNSRAVPTDFEVEEGHKVVWIENIDKALELLESANPNQLDGKLVKARDLIFLRVASSKLA